MSMRRVAVIGDRDSVLGFSALGVSVFPASSPDEAGELLKRVAGEGYAIVFLTEALAKNMDSLIRQFAGRLVPAILLIPNNAGSLGVARGKIKRMVEKAVGTDILFEKEGSA